MKYLLIGVKTCSITQDIQSTIEYVFNSYTEARMNQIVMENQFSDMKFHINFNSNVSLESLMTLVDLSTSSNIPSNFN